VIASSGSRRASVPRDLFDMRGKTTRRPTTPSYVETVSERWKDDIEAVYRSEHARLYHTLLGFTGDRGMAEDALAEAFSRALASGHAIRRPEPWIWTVAFRVASAELKRRALTSVLEEGRVEPPEPPDVIIALAKLPERQRAAVILHYFADRSLADIAQMLGISRATVGVHLHRGRARLAELLEERHD
jgi:RNA polymerase sigma-70 factor (ECF subfamily)